MRSVSSSAAKGKKDETEAWWKKSRAIFSQFLARLSLSASHPHIFSLSCDCTWKISSLSLIHFPCIFSRDGEDKGRAENLFALWHQRICQEKFKDHRVIFYKSLMNLVGYASHRFFLLFNAKPKRTLKTNSIYFRCFNRQPQKLLLSLSVGVEKSINFNFISQNATAGVNVERWISIGEVDFVCWSFLFSFNYTVESQTLT